MLTLAQLADLLGGVWHGNAEHAIFHCASLACAKSQDLAYFDNLLLTQALTSTSAGAVLLKAEHDVVVTGMSTVKKSLNKSGIYSSGTLVHEHQRWRRNAARFKRLDDYIVKLSVLEKAVKQLEFES